MDYDVDVNGTIFSNVTRKSKRVLDIYWTKFCDFDGMEVYKLIDKDTYIMGYHGYELNETKRKVFVIIEDEDKMKRFMNENKI